MARYVMLSSGLERAAEICEQHPEVVAAISELVDQFAARDLDSLAWAALDVLEREDPAVLEQPLREHCLASYLGDVVQQYRNEQARQPKSEASLTDAERLALLREYLQPSPSSRTLRSALSPEGKKLLKDWKAAIKALDQESS